MRTNQIKVLMIGESLSRQGGIVSVQKLILEEIDPSIQVKHIATLVDGSGWQKLKAFISAVIKLAWSLLSQDIDLVHTHVSERGSAFRQAVTTLVAVILHKPVIMHTHGAEFHIFYSELPSWGRQGLSWIFRQCAHFIALSDNWKTFYIQNLGLEVEKVTVLPNAVKIPPQIPQRSHNLGKVSFVFFGRIAKRKGAFDLIEAFANLPYEYQTQARLTLAGDGEVLRLRQIVEELGLIENVTVKDWVSPEQRDRLLEEADVFVLPSYNEGLPMALLEAMSWGLPVITTPVGGIPELVSSHKNGLLVSPGDVSQLTCALQSLITDTKLRLALGQSARESVLPFGIKNYCNSLTDIYSSVLTNK